MSIETLENARSRVSYKLGRKRPIARGPRFSLKNYLTRSFPDPPSSCDYTQAASSALSQMYDNDKLGDCVIAGIAHVVGVMTGNAGQEPFLYTSDQIIALYSAIGGYVPGNPDTDRGCDEETALNYWENNGAPAGSTHKIAGWLAVDSTDPTECRAALWLFENLYFGMELPDDWVNPFPSDSGFVWDVAGDPDPQNGHCVAGFAYNSNGIVIDTWGLQGLLTDAAIAKYANPQAQSGLYTVVSMDSINRATQKAPNGFDWSQLIADFDSLGGSAALRRAFFSKAAAAH
jgi:hypothetical protein